MENKELILQCFGNASYQIIEAYIKESVYSFHIVKHFTEKCNHPIVSINYLRFLILDEFEFLSKHDTEDILLEKKNWFGSLVTHTQVEMDCMTGYVLNELKY